MPRTGRPRKEIDWVLIESLVKLEATLKYCAECQLDRWAEEVTAKSIKSTSNIIEHRIKERYAMTFLEFKEQKKEPLRINLRKKQYDTAMAGNVSMLIWLGKQMLDQSERALNRNEHTGKNGAPIEIKEEVTYTTSWRKLDGEKG